MRQERAKRIMALLGWGPTETARQYNRVAGTNLRRQNINTQINTDRGVSDGLAVFLRMAVKIAVMKRRYDPGACVNRPRGGARQKAA
jgi:hypothetical protein